MRIAKNGKAYPGLPEIRDGYGTHQYLPRRFESQDLWCLNASKSSAIEKTPRPVLDSTLVEDTRKTIWGHFDSVFKDFTDEQIEGIIEKIEEKLTIEQSFRFRLLVSLWKKQDTDNILSGVFDI